MWRKPSLKSSKAPSTHNQTLVCTNLDTIGRATPESNARGVSTSVRTHVEARTKSSVEQPYSTTH
jgi:hypothetical protein